MVRRSLLPSQVLASVLALPLVALAALSVSFVIVTLVAAAAGGAHLDLAHVLAAVSSALSFSPMTPCPGSASSSC